MTEHAKASPSKLAVLEQCPCYWSDPDKKNEAAEEGTMLHEAFERESLDTLAEEEQREAVTSCIKYVEAILHDVDADGGKEMFQVRSELRVTCDLTWGTADKVILLEDRREIHLIDAKFGRLPVDPADENLQGQAYVLCLFVMYPWAESITAHFVQPRIEWSSSHRYTRDPDVSKITDRIAKVLEAFNDPDKQPVTSEKACQFCDAKAWCPAISEVALEVVARSSGLPMPEEFEPGKLVSAEDRSKAHVIANILEDWAQQVKRNNSKAVKEEGLEVPGFDLRERHGGYKVENPGEVLFQAAEMCGVTRDEMLPAVKVSLSELIKLVKLHNSGEDAKDLKRALINASGEAVSERDSVVFLQRKRGITNEEIWEGTESI